MILTTSLSFVRKPFFEVNFVFINCILILINASSTNCKRKPRTLAVEWIVTNYIWGAIFYTDKHPIL